MGIAVTMEGKKADKNEEAKERETRSLDGFFFPLLKRLYFQYVQSKEDIIT